MSYRNAEELLPAELIRLIQQYIDGESIYIPRVPDKRRPWGQKTLIKQELRSRDQNIINDRKSGMNIRQLAEKYFLSTKSIERIIRQHNRIM